MDREVKKKSELMVELVEQLKRFLDPYQVGGADYEHAKPVADEIATLCEIESEFVVVEECPMAESGHLIKACEVKIEGE